MGIKEGDIFFSNHNGTAFKVIKAKCYTVNAGIFGLQDTFQQWVLENLRTYKQTELTEEMIKNLLHK